jgi:uncharacterized protein (TIGR02246 family)
MLQRMLVLAILIPAASAAAQTVGDDAAIRARIAAHGQASAAGDARALSEVYADDAELVSPNGNITRGRAAIDEVWKRDVAAGAARGGRHHMHPPESIRIRFVSPDVAIVDVGSRTLGGVDSTGAALASSEASLLTVWRKTRGDWRVVYQRLLPARPTTTK